MSEYKLYALSIHQPWAWLAVEGLKRYETRGWKTNQRGVLAIHASGTFGEMELATIRGNKTLVATLNDHGIHGGNIRKRLAFGAVVGVVNLADVFGADRISVSTTERAFGDFGEGRYAWYLASAARLDKPILVPGRQGLYTWTVPDAEVKQVRAAVERLKHDGK